MNEKYEDKQMEILDSIPSKLLAERSELASKAYEYYKSGTANPIAEEIYVPRQYRGEI